MTSIRRQNVGLLVLLLRFLLDWELNFNWKWFFTREFRSLPRGKGERETHVIWFMKSRSNLTNLIIADGILREVHSRERKSEKSLQMKNTRPGTLKVSLLSMVLQGTFVSFKHMATIKWAWNLFNIVVHFGWPSFLTFF